MPKSVAIILDGGFVLKKMPHKSPTAKDVYDFALSCIAPEEKLFRMFFYHCLPYDGKEIHPISGQEIDFKNSNTSRHNQQLFSELSEMNFVALRKGRLVFRGWKIKRFTVNKLQQQLITAQQTAAATISNTTATLQQQLSPNDFEPEFTQKEVDIKIGLDVAWLSSRKIVDKIILVSGDTDFVPAMKFARREGVQVIVANIVLNRNSDGYLKGQMKEHSDEVRTLRFENQKWIID